MVIINRAQCQTPFPVAPRISFYGDVNDTYSDHQNENISTSSRNNRFIISHENQMVLYFRTNVKTIVFLALPSGGEIINSLYFDEECDKMLEQDLVLDVKIVQGSGEQFKAIGEFFHFNKKEWADIFAVSRVTIYSWLKNESEPQNDNAKKISTIFNTMSSVSGRKEDNFISRNYLGHKINKYNKSLLEIFTEPKENIQKLSDLPNILSVLMNKTRIHHERMDKLPKDYKGKDQNLSYNLKKLSY